MRKVLLVLLSVLVISCTKKEEEEILPDNLANTEQGISDPELLPGIGTNSEKFEGLILLDQQNNAEFTKRSWQGIPSVVVSKEGAIYAAWYTGAKGEEPGNYVTLAMSTDQGVTWKQNALIVKPAAGARFFDPVLWCDKFGSVFLSWAKSRNSLWDGKGGVWFTRLINNGKLNFTSPRKLGDGVMMCKPLESLDKTSVFYPIAVWKMNNAVNSGIYIYESVYNERMKKSVALTNITKVPFPEEKRIYDEHQIVQLNDKSYMVMIRGTDGLYYTQSEDLKNWSTPSPFNRLGATTSSRFFLGRLQSGKLALVLNNSTTRSNMKIFLSDDDGTTWKYSLLLDSKIGISYPDLSQDTEGRIYIVYDYDRYNEMNINLISFTEEDVINDRPENISRTLISKKN